jgi:hypothetical protein
MARYFLIRFTYDHYCQGWEDATTTVLVDMKVTDRPKSPVWFNLACVKIKDSGVYSNARSFVDLTIR